nr:GDNF family receptor alpha-2 [Odocoileus virginianus texanus]
MRASAFQVQLMGRQLDLLSLELRVEVSDLAGGTGADPAVSTKSNHCLDAAKACNLNDNCKKLRSSYISICNREISPSERCNRRKCHKALRQFFDRVPSEYTYRMLFCSCQDQACAERRRQTILPSCSYEDKEKPNCLDLRSLCRTDHLCSPPGTGADPAVSTKSNHCLDAAKACNLNDNCKKLRSSYISICNREISPSERCNRRKCHKALRQFFDRVPSEYTYRMLFCSCQDQACAERRRQTILPSCSYEDKEKPNCLDLRSLCRTDHLCRSRLADFHANCRASYQTLTSCPTDNYQACLGSYAGMIGFDITPNYVDSSPTGIVVSPWCSCRGSGNMEEECEKFLKDFTENPCLRNAIQAFGNGTDVNLSPKNPPFQATQAPRVEKTPSLPDDLSDSTSLGTSVITTCTSVQEQGLKANNSKELSMCFTELTTNIIPGSKRVIKPNSGPRRARPSAALTAASFLMLKLAL